MDGLALAGRWWAASLALAASAVPAIAAAECTQSTAPIETDRPDITNSSVVVPVGSFQSENGVNISRRELSDRAAVSNEGI
jgi:hypothetical protein